MNVGIVGLGLIGGSLARDLVARGHHVTGFDASAATRAAAGDLDGLDVASSRDFRELADCDLVVLAVPVDAAAHVMRRARRALTHVKAITDVGSTKRNIVRAAEAAGIGERFVGSHPMAGDHRTGWTASRPGLFTGATVYLVPTRRSKPSVVRTVEAFWRDLGAAPARIGPEAHDRRVAVASHMPHTMAVAIALAASSSRVPRAAMGRGGRDMTRLAASDARLWAAILRDNRASVKSAVSAVRESLSRLERALDGEEGYLVRVLGDAHRWAARVDHG